MLIWKVNMLQCKIIALWHVIIQYNSGCILIFGQKYHPKIFSQCRHSTLAVLKAHISKPKDTFSWNQLQFLFQSVEFLLTDQLTDAFKEAWFNAFEHYFNLNGAFGILQHIRTMYESETYLCIPFILIDSLRHQFNATYLPWT